MIGIVWCWEKRLACLTTPQEVWHGRTILPDDIECLPEVKIKALEDSLGRQAAYKQSQDVVWSHKWAGPASPIVLLRPPPSPYQFNLRLMMTGFTCNNPENYDTDVRHISSTSQYCSQTNSGG